MRAYELEESAVEELKNRLPKLKVHSYNTIDRLMNHVSVKHKITGKKLHDMFVSKYGHTPDTWINKIKNKLGEEGVPQPGESSGAPKQFGPDAKIETRQMTAKDIISSVPAVPYYNNVVDDWDAKDYSWGVTKKVIEYATYLKQHPETLAKLPPAIVLNGKFEDGAHRVSALWLLQQRMDPKNPLWKNAKLNVQFVKQGVAEGWDPDTQRLEQDVRDALENGDDYTAKQYAKMASTPQAKQYLLNIIKQAMYIDDLGGETDWKGVAEGSEEDSYSDKFVQSQIDYYKKHGLSGNAGDRERINGSLNYYSHIKNKRIKDGTWSLEQGVAEGSGKNVVKSIKVGNFRHDLVDTGMGWQVRIYNGDELYDTGMSKNSEQKGLAALEDAVAYTEKQTRTKRQGVAEGLSKQFEIIYREQNGDRKRKIVSGTSKEAVARQFKKQYKLEIEQVKQLQQGVAEGINDSSKDYGTDEVTITFDGDIPSEEEIIQYCKKNYGFVPASIDIEPPSDFRGMSNPGIIRVKQGVAEGYSPKKNSKIVEGVDSPQDIEKIKHFIKWSYKALNMQKPYPKITISKNTKVAQAGHHTGVHKGNDIWIYVGNRNLIDIFRTIFHELTHHRQMQLNMIKDGDSYPGSPIEMLADMAAGKYIKFYGKEHPEIFQ